MTEQDISLDAILGGESPSDEVYEAEPVEEKAEESTGEDEASAEAQAEEKAESNDEPPSSKPEKPPEGFVPQTALLDERGKRQDLQRQLDELRGMLQAQQKPEAKADEEPVDFLDDPDKWAARLQKQVDERARQAEITASVRVLNALESAAKARHSDYDEAAQAFAQIAQGNLSLQQEAANAPDPAEFVYQAGRRLMKLNSANGDLEALIQREREAAIAEYLQKHPTPAQRAIDVPESLSSVTGATKRTQSAPVDVPLESMFNNF